MEGRSWLEEVLAMRTAHADSTVRGRALLLLGNLARRQGEYAFAVDAFQELLAIRQVAGDRRGAAQALGELANVHYLRADYAAAWVCLEASRTTADDSTVPLLADGWRFVGGQVALHEGRYDLAQLLLTEALEESDQQDESLYTGYCMMNLGVVAREQSRYPESGRLLDRSLDIAVRYGDRTLLAHSLEGLCGLAAALGQHERAVRLGGAAAVLREAAGAPLSPAWERTIERWLGVSRAALTDAAATAAWETGQDMPLEEVIAYARARDLATSNPVLNVPVRLSS
jgi:tetratricopeptide (TPR) repeat protein